jgi:elongation factor P
MASTTDFRNGLVMRLDNELWSIVEFQHVKPGKGGAFVRTRLKNVKTGRVLDKTFRSGEKVEDVRLERKKYQFLYKGDSEYVFMDMQTYEQVSVQASSVGETSKYIIDGMEVEILFGEGEVLGVEAPIFVELEITQTDPGIKGDPEEVNPQHWKPELWCRSRFLFRKVKPSESIPAQAPMLSELNKGENS